MFALRHHLTGRSEGAYCRHNLECLAVLRWTLRTGEQRGSLNEDILWMAEIFEILFSQADNEVAVRVGTIYSGMNQTFDFTHGGLPILTYFHCATRISRGWTVSPGLSAES